MLTYIEMNVCWNERQCVEHLQTHTHTDEWTDNAPRRKMNRFILSLVLDISRQYIIISFVIFVLFDYHFFVFIPFFLYPMKI